MNQKKLDETWKNCLAMWKWMAKRVRRPHKCVEDLKKQWLRGNGFTYLTHNCFFCDYDKLSCEDCPAVLVDPNFHCTNSEHHWERHPILFYKKLVSLNRKRKRNRGK